MSSTRRLIELLIDTGSSEDEIVSVLSTMSVDELYRLGAFGRMITELAEEGLDESRLRTSWPRRNSVLRIVQTVTPRVR